MNAVVLNDNVIKIIKESLPKETNITNFLSGFLPLGREAVYRRLRGEVCFSFFEVCTIAQKLGVSLDLFFRTCSNDVYFELVQQQFQEIENDNIKASNKFEQTLGEILTDSSSKFELSHNLFPQVPTHLFYHLSKYNSFKWIYKNGIAQTTSYKEVEYPQSIYQMHKDNNMTTMNIKETSYIWDYTIVETMIREIKYFENINLLDSQDIAILKEELHEFLYYVENLTEKGFFPTGNKIDIYISSINTDAAYSYMESPNSQISIIGVFDFQYIISTDSHAFEMMKRKIMSLKKGAILISRSNEIYRISFFRKQHELVNTL